jgi:hypothetical protein
MPDYPQNKFGQVVLPAEPRMPIYEDVCVYLKDAIAMFNKDPASTEFQKGYLACLKETLMVAEAIKAVQ